WVDDKKTGLCATRRPSGRRSKNWPLCHSSVLGPTINKLASVPLVGPRTSREGPVDKNRPLGCKSCPTGPTRASRGQVHIAPSAVARAGPAAAVPVPSPASSRAQSRGKVVSRVSSQPTGPSRPAVWPDRFRSVAQFRDYHPEKFSGQGYLRIVDEWVQGLELIFEVMDCQDRYRVTCAQLQLTGDARLWWNAYWSMRPGEKEGCTWERFKEMIREMYYPTYYRAEMERQFMSLKQGTRTVDEYEREFTRLGAFVPDLVRTEAQRAQRFTDGLYPAVRHNIV
ncbi:Unknown protein, partial [Striga hermonthica]